MHPRRNSIRFAAALLATNLKASLMLRGAFAMQVIFMALNNFTFFVFWWVPHAPRAGNSRGWRLTDIELLFGIVAVAVGLAITVAGGVRYPGQFIEQGELDTLLVQPPAGAPARRRDAIAILGVRRHGVRTNPDRAVWTGLVDRYAACRCGDRCGRTRVCCFGHPVLQRGVLAGQVGHRGATDVGTGDHVLRSIPNRCSAACSASCCSR